LAAIVLPAGDRNLFFSLIEPNQTTEGFFSRPSQLLFSQKKRHISNNIKQNIEESHSNIHRKILHSLWILKSSRKKSANQKSLQTFAKCLCFQKRNTKP
jgi:hypothetical protein